MRMRGKKAIFNEKDTYSLDVTLNPIIAEGVRKFRDTIKRRIAEGYCAGVPLLDMPSDMQSVEGDELREKLWFEVLDKIIYAFDADEPVIPDGIYSFEDCTQEGGLHSTRVIVANEGLRDAYTEEAQAHSAKVKEGHMLFAEHYGELWW